MSQEHSFLTNRLLGRSRCLAEAAANLPDPRPNLAAAAVELDRAVCSLMAEILDASPQQSRAMILGGHFALELGRIDDRLPGELEELRLLRAEPGSFLQQLEQYRLLDLQPPPPMPAQHLIHLQTDLPDADQLLGWIDQFGELLERFRQTAYEC